MEGRIKELEGQVKSLQNNLAELMRIQIQLVKALNKQADTINEMSKLDELQTEAVEQLMMGMGVYK